METHHDTVEIMGINYPREIDYKFFKGYAGIHLEPSVEDKVEVEAIRVKMPNWTGMMASTEAYEELEEMILESLS